MRTARHSRPARKENQSNEDNRRTTFNRQETTHTDVVGSNILLCVAAQRRYVVTDWNGIASTTIVANGGKSAGASAVWFAYTSLAVYDAVNAITGDYRPFYYQGVAPRDASLEAAAAAAAHRVLVNYFPSQQTTLDGRLSTSLAAIPASSSKDDGMAEGEAAAMAVIGARSGDGLEDNVTYTPGSGPGAWIPTPPAFAAPATPWLGQMRPFAMKGASDFLPGPRPRSAARPGSTRNTQAPHLWRYHEHDTFHR